MADFSTPVRIPRAAFDQLIVRVDDAIGKNDVALMLHEDYPFRNLDLITSSAIDFSGIDIEDDPLDVVENLDQLLYFAFEFASRRVISSWASEHGSDLEKEAIERVEAIRKGMTNLGRLWRAKNNCIVPPLVEFNYDVIDADSSNEPYINLYLAAGRIDTSDGTPDKSDIARLRVQLWPSDVRVLMRELAHIWYSHLSDEHEHEDEAKGEADGNQASS